MTHPCRHASCRAVLRRLRLSHEFRAVLFALSCAAAVSACATASEPLQPAKEAIAMTTPATPGDPGKDAMLLHSKLTAEQVLTRLLDLIRSSKHLSDFTPERMSQVMGVEFVTYRPGYHAFGEQVTSDWWYSLEKEDGDRNGPYFTLRFTPEDSKNASDVSMVDVCQFDLGRFSAELEAMGFSRTPHYDSAPPAPPPPFPGNDARPEHGGLMDYTFERVKDGQGEMMVVVYPGYARDEHTGTGRECVKMVRIY